MRAGSSCLAAHFSQISPAAPGQFVRQEERLVAPFLRQAVVARGRSERDDWHPV